MALEKLFAIGIFVTKHPKEAAGGRKARLMSVKNLQRSCLEADGLWQVIDRRSTEMEDMLQVGAITSTHGLAGEVKVFPTTDDPKRYDHLKEVCLDTGKEMRKLEIQRVKYFKQFVIVKFKGLDRIEEVERYVKKSLFVTRENAVELEEDEYFIADLIGLSVIEEDGKKLGTLTDVLSTGANDVYVVTEGEREILIPAIGQCILNVDLEQREMKVHLLEGLV